MENNKNSKKNTEGMEWICRPYITLKNGQRLYASSVGKKAFCFWAKPRTS
jgi:hypothetical protein